MTLLQSVLRSHTETLEQRLASTNLNARQAEDSEDEWVNVVSLPGTPARSTPSSRCPSRPSSPSFGAASRQFTRSPIPHTRDPLRALPTELSQRIFGFLPIKDLARCAVVCRKWCKSQTLNYVWFQHYRKENFCNSSLPPGKWTRRESKQNWVNANRPQPSTLLNDDQCSGRSSPSSSGYRTPKELQEERWRLEAEAASRPGKLEMRTMYKELGGRKSRGKTKFGSGGIRDKGAWFELEEP